MGVRVRTLIRSSMDSFVYTDSYLADTGTPLGTCQGPMTGPCRWHNLRSVEQSKEGGSGDLFVPPTRVMCGLLRCLSTSLNGFQCVDRSPSRETEV